MSYKRLVMLADSEEHIRTAAPVAKRLGIEFDASILGMSTIDATITERRLIEQLPKAAAKQYRDARENIRAKLKKTFETELDRDDVSRLWVEEHGDADFNMQREMLYADVALLAAPTESAIAGYQATVHQILIDSYKPTIVCPPVVEDDMLDTVCVAWNSSAQAARAVHFALPILRKAKSVQVFALCTDVHRETQQIEIDRLHSFLVSHGIENEASIRVVPAATGAAFMAELEHSSATFAVMGAWGQTRLRQLVVGGFTRHAIRHSNCPILMAH